MGTKEQEPCPKGIAFAAKGAASGTAVKTGRHGRKCRMDIGEVRQMLKDGCGVEDIRKHYGYKTKQSVENFLKKNGINMKLYRAGTYREVTEAELGTSKKLLYAYLQKHPKLVLVRKR